MVVNPRHYDRWSGAHLVQGCKRPTSGFLFRCSSEMRVSRVDFSGPYQRCIGMRMQGGAARAAVEQPVRGGLLAGAAGAWGCTGHAYAVH
jgi:hypothetical protein